ncbi:P-loop NTPase fold protein [Haliovirga abyssi]|uniref:KAP NTPase domain-containing protein n=1 Tax=Haliovirga abyssi TaxID=2996794 RepID=A0AAU9DF86_9FUSO|nr:P-loop NTPase fold protein [Haliovirga abyssi]BDU50032.1 hypothetical protein HLVA_06010 [Haliovirga abyssi]
MRKISLNIMLYIIIPFLLGITFKFKIKSFNIEKIYSVFFITVFCFLIFIFIYKNKEEICSIFIKILKFYSILLFLFFSNEMTLDFFKNIYEYTIIIMQPIILSFVIIIILLVVVSIIAFIYKKLKKRKHKKETKLIKSREVKFIFLKNSLKINKTILIDGEWGIGKTTFLNIALKKLNDEYHQIKIDVLIFNNRKAIKEEFTNQLKNIFKQENIFFKIPDEFSHFIDSLGNNIFSFFKKILFETSSFQEAKDKLNNDLKILDREIIIVFDNLERIMNTDFTNDSIWKEVISFIHELSELENIRIILVADYKKLVGENKEENLNLHKEYFDKFYDEIISIKKAEVDNIIDALDEEYKSENDEELNYFKEIEMILRINISAQISSDNDDKSDKYNKLKKYEDRKKNPRVIEKIIKKYKMLKEGFKDIKKIEKIDLMRAAIFEIIYFEELQNYNLDNFEEIKNIKFFEIFLDVVGKKDRINIFKQIFFIEKKTILRSKMELEKLEKSKKINEIRLEKINEYIEYIEVYNVIENNINNLYKPYDIVIKNLEKLYEDGKINGEAFYKTINKKIIWEIESKKSKDEIGDLCEFIKVNKINPKYANSGIDFYVMNFFEDVFKDFIRIFSDKYDNFFKTDDFGFMVKAEGDQMFPNYDLFISWIEEKFEIEIKEKYNFDEILKDINKQILDKSLKEFPDSEKIVKFFKNKFKILFGRLKILCNNDMVDNEDKLGYKAMAEHEKQYIESLEKKSVEELTNKYYISVQTEDSLKEIEKICRKRIEKEEDIENIVKLYGVVRVIEKNLKIRK